MLERLLFMIRLTDGITKKRPCGVLAGRGWQESSQGTTAKTDRKFENLLRKLKELKGKYKLKPHNRTLLLQKGEEQCLYTHSA